MHAWSTNISSSIGKLHILCSSVQMAMIHDQEHNLDFGIYLWSNLPILPMRRTHGDGWTDKQGDITDLHHIWEAWTKF